MVTAAVSLTTVLTVASAVATVVAAIAACVAINFARQTVDEAKRAREEAHEYHQDEVRAARKEAVAADERHKAELDEVRRAAKRGQAQHEQNMAELASASSRTREEARLLQLDRVTELVLAIVDVARDEMVMRPPRINEGGPGSRLPPMLLRLGSAVEVLRALGGPVPERAADFANRGYLAGSPTIQYLGDGVDALRDVQRVVDELRRSGEQTT